jgi:phospholipid/cholesterol/gamma-HCH transport system substrate-binding protein
MKISKEGKVGLLAIVAMAMLYFGFNFLKGSDLFSRTKTYKVIYDNIDGLTVSNPVLLNGMPVGRVDEIEIMQDKDNALLVTLDIQKEIILKEGSVAILADGGLLGGKVIRLKVSPTGNVLEDEAELVAQKEAGITALLQEKALPVVTHADSLILNLSAVAEGFKETGSILNQVLTSYKQTGQTLDAVLLENKTNLVTLTGNLNKLSGSLVETEKELKPLLGKAGNLVDSLNALQLGEMVASAKGTIAELRQVIASIEEGNGTVGKLVKDEALYANLNRTVVSMNMLLTNFREHPKRYVNISVFGKKDKGPSVSKLDTTTAAN